MYKEFKMKQFILIIIAAISLCSCSSDDESQVVCIDGSCDANFWIDTLGHPGTYQDNNGVWHIKHAGLNYFTVKGNLSELDPHFCY